MLVRLLKPLNTISRKHFYFDSDENVIISKESYLDKYSYDWLNKNVFKTEEEIRSSMTSVDGWEITLNPELFGEFRQIVKSFDQMLNTQGVKYDRQDKVFSCDNGSKFVHYDSSLFLENSGLDREDCSMLDDICYTWIEEGYCTWDMTIRNKHDSLSDVYGLLFDFDCLYDEEWNLEEFDKPRLIKIIKDLEGLIKDTIDIARVGLGRKD